MKNKIEPKIINLANIITISRIPCSLGLLFYPPFSPVFYSLYLIAGISDMIDGWIARRANTATEFGAKLDTFADLVFVIVCLFKLLPLLNIPTWLYVWIGIIATIKIINIISGYVVQKQFVAIHSCLNKACGILLFILPLTISFIDLKYSSVIICIIATFAAIQEGHWIRTKKKI